MKEGIERCEHCGNINRSGALHCDICGRGIAGNLAVGRAEYTKKTIISFALCLIGALIVVAIILSEEYLGLSYYIGIDSEALSFVVFLAFAAALLGLILGLKFLSQRKKFLYTDHSELDLQGEPEGEEEFRLNDAELTKSLTHYKQREKVFVSIALPFLAVGVIAIMLSDNGQFSTSTLVGLISFAIAVIFFGIAGKNTNAARKLYKVNIVRNTLAEIIDDCVYRSDGSINSQRVEATNLFHGWNKFSGNDYIRGKYKGHVIEFSDIHLEEEHSDPNDDDTNRTVTETIFRGHWIICRLNKTLPAFVRLREGKGSGNAETESAAFNAKYEITTDDPHSLFYVLTPHFMEYIVAADETVDAKTFFCFTGNLLHIAVYNNCDSFELSGSDPSAARERVKREMKYILDILDVLFQNENLFGAEEPAIREANEV